MLTFDEKTHVYRWSGVRVPNVTTIIGEAGMKNFDMVEAGLLRRAGEFGDAVHKACEYSDNGTLGDVDDAVLPYLNAWQTFLSDYNAEVLENEKRVYSEKYNFAGCIDRVLLIGKTETLVDIKSATVISPTWDIQTGAYNLLRPCKARWTVKLEPESKVPYRVIEHKCATDAAVFLSALQLYRWKQQHKLIKEVSNG
jgi:hypothetical protein